MSDYPIFDAERSPRDVLGHFGPMEPSIDEIGTRCEMPVRLVWNYACLEIEVGPYTLSASDIEVMREAIDVYTSAVGGE